MSDKPGEKIESKLERLEEKLMDVNVRNALLAFNVALGVVAIYLVFVIWPTGTNLNTDRTVSAFGIFPLALNAETTYILMVVFASIIGATVQAIGSIAQHCSKCDLTSPWAVWYFTRPMVGAGLALALYFVIRGGLLNLSTDASALSIYGIAGLSGIVGMFTNQATLKLRDVAETLLSTKEVEQRKKADEEALAKQKTG